MHSALNIKNLPEKEVVKHKGKKKTKNHRRHNNIHYICIIEH